MLRLSLSPFLSAFATTMATMGPTRSPCLSVAEFTALVAVALFGPEADLLDPEFSYVTEHSKLRSGTPPSPSCLAPPPRSFSTTGLSSDIDLLVNTTPPNDSTATLVHGIHRPVKRRNTNLPVAAEHHRYPTSGPLIPMSSAVTMFYPDDSSSLAISSPSPGRKPLALLSKLKRQASALVKSGNSTSPTTQTGPNHSGWSSVATTRFHPGRPVPSVSFAPTPAPSVFAFPVASSIAPSRASMSGISDADSFLDCEDGPRRSFGSRRVRQGRSLPAAALFRNRNTHLSLNDTDSQQDLRSTREDDMQSVMTEETTTSMTTDAFSTDSEDYIPYIPLVIQHERQITKMRSVQQLSRVPLTASGRRAEVYSRSTPSPTPSQSTIGSASSTHSPRTPKTPFFGHSGATPPISVNSEEENEDMLSITSSFSPGDGYEFTSPHEGKSKLSSVGLSERAYGKPKFAPRSSSAEVPQRYSHSHTSDFQEDDDSFLHQTTPKVQGPAVLEDDRQTMASTSESCYSTQSYNGPSLDLYRRTRMDSMDANHHAGAADIVTEHRCSYPPPAIRVETASTESEIPTPSASMHSHICNSELLYPHPAAVPKPRYQTQIGVGRQTIDPRSIDSAGRGREPAEWTLLLGEEETSLSRARKASESGSVGTARGASKSPDANKERTRKKSASPSGIAPSLTVHLPISLPFASELHVQTPLLRVQSLLAFGESEDMVGGSSEADDGRLTKEDRERALRRSGSANPVLDGGRKDRRSDGDQVDWTLMLPLPFPKRTKSNAIMLSVPLLSPKMGDKKRVVTKARSSVDLTSPATHMRSRKLSSPLLYDKKQHKKELSAEEMLAAILDSSAVSISNTKTELGRCKMDRDEHRQRALDMLSGSSALFPSTSKSGSPPQISKVHVSVRDSRPPSPSPSILRFEQRLSNLMALEGVLIEKLAADNSSMDLHVMGQDSHIVESSKPFKLSSPNGLPLFAPPTELSLPPRHKQKSSPALPFPSLPSRSTRTHSAGSVNASQTPNSTSLPSTPLPPSSRMSLTIGPRSQSLTTRAPIGVARESVFGLSFSQHGPLPTVASKRPSFEAQPRPLPNLGGMVRSTSLLVKTPRSSTARTPPQPSAERRSPANKGCLPIKIPVIEHHDICIEPASPTRSLALSLSSTSSSISSASSTRTVVPTGKNHSSGYLSTQDSLLSPQTPLLEDFPLPPTSLPLNNNNNNNNSGIVATNVPMSTKPSFSCIPNAIKMGEELPLLPVLGADEDIELPPPTPKMVSPTHTRHSRSPPRRTSPISDRLPYPLTVFRAVDTSVSQWMDDDDDDDETEDSTTTTSCSCSCSCSCSSDERNDSSGGGAETETEYEDALSMFAMSDEEYEDAVSMLSGVFYSARTSFDG